MYIYDLTEWLHEIKTSNCSRIALSIRNSFTLARQQRTQTQHAS